MMCVSDPIVRSVSVRGSCAEWAPVVADSLRLQGFTHVVADLRSQRFTAAYPGGSMNVILHPSEDGLETLISVSVLSDSLGGVL